MNSKEFIPCRRGFFGRLLKWPWLCGLLGFALNSAVHGADALFQNDGIINYPAIQSYMPQVDATNFVNTCSFIINYTTISASQPFYEMSDTVNFTNTGLMEANTGFQFETDSSTTGLGTMAGSFFNSGTVSCGSYELDDFFYNSELNGINLLGFSGLGQCLVNASNIVNSGTVQTGVGGLIRLTGQNIDLTRSTLTMEGFIEFDGSFDSITTGANVAGSGFFAVNTNAWDPSLNLTTNLTTTPTLSNLSTFQLLDSTVYIQTNFNAATSNNVIRAVFIQDSSLSNVDYNVYFDTADQGVGGGSATIEWIGSYVDTATGNSYSNYLYLNNDYVLGSSTNVALVNGYPDNFQFTESPSSLEISTNAATSGFPSINPFIAGGITNAYAYVGAQLISVSENLSSIPNASITNLPGRLEISAANDLDLTFAQISGLNYMSIQATNQFDGSSGASIETPYADINIGVTNGFLAVSNLMQATIPNWQGSVQAWSTRWLEVVNGVTNDYRVLLVASQLFPTTPSRVQNLTLHGTNSIVISDVFNVMKSFYADAQNLTLTTNNLGTGSTSLEGELNLNLGNILFQNSLPNLINLTNNGAIRTLNQANFGNPLVISVTPSVPGVAATGNFYEAGTNFVKSDKVTIGTNQYIFVKTVTNSVSGQIKIGTNFDSSMSNLIAAINHSAGAGTNYSTSTAVNALVTASVLANHAFIVTASTAGAAGNSIATAFTPSTGSINALWSSASLTGGVDFVAAVTNSTPFSYNNFINNGLVSDQGSIIYAKNFLNDGFITNGSGSFALQSFTSTFTNGSLIAGGDISIGANILLVSNLSLQAGRSLTLQATNLLTDGGIGNGDGFSVGGASSVGINLPIKPLMGDLLATTITNMAYTNKNVIDTWAATDYGATPAGFTNNSAVGRLVIDSIGANGLVTFKGAGTSNAIYVDRLELVDQATNMDASGNPRALTNNANIVIYYAQALVGGVTAAEKLNHKNNNHLRWVPAYTGTFSSTNIVINGVTNVFNTALAQSTDIDSDGDGVVNADDPTPFFVSSEVAFKLSVTNTPSLSALLSWQTIPGATNFVSYTTNLVSPSWITLTNFITPTAPPYGPITNALFDVIGNSGSQRFYRVRIDPNAASVYGNN